MLIFGGTNNEGAFLNEVFTLNLETLEWGRVISAPGSTVPNGRYAHCASMIGTSMYIFGGITAEGNSADLARFNFDSKLWTILTPTSILKPSSRSYGVSVSYNSNLYIFGGKTNVGFKDSFFKYSLSHNIWKIVWSMSDLERTITNSSPVVPVDPLPKELICPIHKDLLIEPVELSCKHVFCGSCILNRESCFICTKSIVLDEISVPQKIVDQINELKIYCMYGCKLGNGKWSRDPSGCQQIVINKTRSDHEATCSHNVARCPNSSECILKSRNDLPKHLEEECNFHNCPHHEFGCKFQEKKKNIPKHLEDCIYEKLKSLLYPMKEQISSQQRTITSLQQQLKIKDEMILILQDPTSQLNNSNGSIHDEEKDEESHHEIEI